MIVVLTAAAAADLEAIADYIARDNPRRAASFVAELIERCDRLPRRRSGFRWCRAIEIAASDAACTADI